MSMETPMDTIEEQLSAEVCAHPRPHPDQRRGLKCSEIELELRLVVAPRQYHLIHKTIN